MTTDAGQLILDAASLLVAAADNLNDATGDVHSATLDEAVEALFAIRTAMAAIKQCEAGHERWIATCFRAEGWRDPHEFIGLGMVEVRRSKDRRAWDHDTIRRDWLAAYMSDIGGEVPDPAQVRDAFLKVASVSQYKVTGLRELGLDPDDYCSSTPGTPRVVIGGQS